jgi:diguanylate cyclase (GGDEF)-like protein
VTPSSPGRPGVAPTRPRRVTRWEVWGLPRKAVALVLLVDAAALLTVTREALSLQLRGADVLLGCLLVLLGVAQTEVACQVERLRRRTSADSYYDLSSVWTVAAALLLPPAVAAGVVVGIYLHLWLRVWRPARSDLYKNVYTAAVVVLAVQAAHHVAGIGVAGRPDWSDGAPGLLLLALAVAAYATVNNLLVIGAIALGDEDQPAGLLPRLRHLVGPLDDIVLEVSTLCMGALAAVVLRANVWLVPLVLVPLVVLHRAIGARQLEQRAATDGKTGLLNAAAWHDRAERALARAQRQGVAAGVLILDLDHFKLVNDTHGHLAGDEVLAAVARTLRDELREADVVGRFGGEEFVVLLRDLPLTTAGRDTMAGIAERIRARVAELSVEVATPDGPMTVRSLTISVGAVFHLGRTSTLQQVLGVADTALYAAKRSGRNAVCFGAPALGAEPPAEVPDAVAPVAAPAISPRPAGGVPARP